MRSSEIDASRLIKEIYAAALEVGSWNDLLDQMRRAFGGSDAALMAWDARTSRPHLAATRAEPMAEYMRHWDGHNILKRPGIRLHTGSVTVDAALQPRDVLERSDYYNGFLLPHDMAHLLVFKLCASPLGDTVVSVTRSRRSGDFDAAADWLARQLVPHFQNAVELASRLGQKAIDPVRLDQSPTAAILLDASGRSIYLNPAAARLLAGKDGIASSPNGLVAARRGDTNRLAMLLAAAVAGRGGALTVPRPSGRRPLALIASPLQAGFDWLQRPRAAALLSIIDPEQDVGPAPERLRLLYGLTPAEASLVLRIARGEELRYAAAVMGITVLTARQYLSRAFRKTGTSRQHDLARLVTILGMAQLP